MRDFGERREDGGRRLEGGVLLAAAVGGPPSAARPAAPLAAPVPWYVAATLVAATSAKVGIIWDISWHRSIGRDTFCTPAHASIYLGGVLEGLPCGSLVVRMSFAGAADERAVTLGLWG